MITVFLHTPQGDTTIAFRDVADVNKLVETFEDAGCVVYSIDQDGKSIYNSGIRQSDLYDMKDLYA